MTSVRKIAGRMPPGRHDNQERLQAEREACAEVAGASWAYQRFDRDCPRIQCAASGEATAWAAKRAAEKAAPQTGTMAKITRIKVPKRRLGERRY